MLILLTGFLSCYDGVLDAYDNNVEYKLRDRGPAGGWIFYDKGFYSDGWRYLEAAPVDQADRAWGTDSTSVSGADGTAVGTGKQNTLDIIAGDPLPNKVADECANYSVNSGGVIYDDWFLPSKDELDLMCWNLRGRRHSSNPLYVTPNNPEIPTAVNVNGGVGGFLDASYWSSSEHSTPTMAVYQTFNDGSNIGGSSKNVTSYHVRAIRAF